MRVRNAVNQIAERSAAVAGAQRDGRSKIVALQGNPREKMLLLFGGALEGGDLEDAIGLVVKDAELAMAAFQELMRSTRDPEMDEDALHDEALTATLTLSFLFAQSFLTGYLVGKEEPDAE